MIQVTLVDLKTPAELTVRDNNNRSRANHTGTQLASTISDFQSSVRSTDLPGLSFLKYAYSSSRYHFRGIW